MTVSTCKSCGASIVWVVLPSGKSAPLDERPFTAWVLDAAGAQEGSPKGRPIQVRQSHFATCGQADQWRKPREGA